MAPQVRELPKPEIQRIPEKETGNPEASQLTQQAVLAQDIQRNSIAADNPQPPKPRGRPIDPNSQRQQKLNNPKPPAQSKPVIQKGKVGPPDFTEWQDFIGGVVIHWATYAFVSVALRGIDRSILTEDEREDIELDEDEERAIAKPFSNMMLNSKLNGKYGRAILNAKDTIEATVILFFFMARVNRVGKKYRPKHAKIITTRNGEMPQNVTDLSAARIVREGNTESQDSEAPPPPIWNGGNAGSFYRAPGLGFN